MDDINDMECLAYVEELSALWHFALNATHMIMRLHFGDSVLDHQGNPPQIFYDIFA
jgi:hypothetical protein